jgi:UDP-glucose 4-epimerase
MNQILQGQPMTIFGDGTQTRAFSYIDDVAPMIADAIDRPQSWNQTFNVGADQPYSLLELAMAVAAAMGVAPRIQHLEPRHEVQHAHSSHEKAHLVFGVRPQTTLEAGLARMAAWVRAHGARTSAPFEGIEITRQLPPAWQTR